MFDPSAPNPANNGGFTPRLGLVCISDCDAVRFRNMTRKRYLQFEPPEREAMLARLYAENVRILGEGVAFCLERGLRLYRLTSRLFPFADEPEGVRVLEPLLPALAAVGRRATAEGLRLVVHPDQFVVLSSDTPQVIENSIKILRMHGMILDALEQPRSAWATIILHGGKGDRAERLVEVVRGLPENIRTRLALENDERAYSAAEILAVCRAAGVPMVFDAHHHLIHERLDSYEDPSVAAFVEAARETWPDPAWQLTHISNGRDGLLDSAHSDLIAVMPSAYRSVPWIEVEAKRKEVAIERLMREWLPTLGA